MRIEQELKLGFKDVLFRPKRSTLKSRSQVNLTRDFTFKHSGRQWSGVPVIAANMDSVGSFAMAKASLLIDTVKSTEYTKVNTKIGHLMTSNNERIITNSSLIVMPEPQSK